MKTLATFISNIKIYNSLPDNVQADVHELVPAFRTHLAAILKYCTVENPGFSGDAHTWTFEADVQHPDLRKNESVVFGLDFDRETSTASTWAYIQKDGVQVEDTYDAKPASADPLASVLDAVRNYRDLKENTPQTPGEYIRLQVTNVQVYPFKDALSLTHCKALATIVLNDQFTVRGLRVMEGDFGLFVGYPLDPYFKGEDFRSVCNPLTRELREHIESAVLERYHELV
jgi:stage V sporulation protein G